MIAIILAGGLGTRLSEETGDRPKPMVEIGGKPILWHIMKTIGMMMHDILRRLVLDHNMIFSGISSPMNPLDPPTIQSNT